MNAPGNANHMNSGDVIDVDRRRAPPIGREAAERLVPPASDALLHGACLESGSSSLR